MSTATEILRVRAAVRRRVSNDPDTLAMADEIEALAELLAALEQFGTRYHAVAERPALREVWRRVEALESAITARS